MTPATALIPGLDGIVKLGDAGALPRGHAPHRGLFFEEVMQLRPEHINLFDGLLIDLVPFAEVPTHVDLAERLSRH